MEENYKWYIFQDNFEKSSSKEIALENYNSSLKISLHYFEQKIDSLNKRHHNFTNFQTFVSVKNNFVKVNVACTK